MMLAMLIILNGRTHTVGAQFGIGPLGKHRAKSDGRAFRFHKQQYSSVWSNAMMRVNAYSNKQVRAVLQRILEFVIGSIVFLLMMVGTVLLMAVLEPSFFSNWF
jgi:hypothetical protein